jgi:hypothetical protein
MAGRLGRRDESQERGDGQEKAPHQRIDDFEARKIDGVLLVDEPDAPWNPSRQANIGVYEREEEKPENSSQDDLETQRLGENLSKPHLLKPEPIGVKRDRFAEKGHPQKKRQKKDPDQSSHSFHPFMQARASPPVRRRADYSVPRRAIVDAGLGGKTINLKEFCGASKPP